MNGANRYVNGDASGVEIRAAILDAETMEPLPGLSASECVPLVGDHLRGRLVWPEGSTLAIEKPVLRPVRAAQRLTVRLLAGWMTDAVGRQESGSVNAVRALAGASLCEQPLVLSLSKHSLSA